jgi:hypothetical protein
MSEVAPSLPVCRSGIAPDVIVVAGHSADALAKPLSAVEVQRQRLFRFHERKSRRQDPKMRQFGTEGIQMGRAYHIL